MPTRAPRRAPGSERFRFTTTRPVAVLTVFCAILVFGWFSAARLPLNLMPEISYPKLTVRAEYEGAAPAEVENDVARPLEEVLGVVTGVTSISSVSTAGNCDVVLEFAWDTDMDDANQDVLEKIDGVKPLLPDEVKQPLILRYDPSLDPVLVLSLSGEGESFEGEAGLKYLRRIADREIRRLLEPIDGVAAVKVKGGLEEEIHVELDEDALRRTGVGVSTVTQRLAAENINLAGGSMREGRTRYLIRTVNEFRDLEDLREVVIVNRDGREVKLRDLGKVTSAYKERDVITRVDGAEAVEIEIYKEADANIVDMAAQVRERLRGKMTGMGPIKGVAQRVEEEHGAKLQVVTDRSLFIKSSIDEVRNTAIQGGLLAVLVLFIFLRQARPTIIVAVAIPTSILITFAPLNLSGVSLNVMSLGGMALGIGMLVDNAIVVLESIFRCQEEGDSLVEATVRGTAEVGSAVAASTLTSIAVFFPMVFVEGVAGQMFGDLGLTVVFSLLASLAVALFLIPMLASREMDAGPEGGFFGGLAELWTSWGSFAALAETFRSLRWFWWLTILPIFYVLLRLALHVCFELFGKLISTFGLLGVRVAILVTMGIAWVVGQLLRPVLWVFDKLLSGLGDGYRVIIRWCLRNPVMVYAIAISSMGSTLFMFGSLDTELIPELHQGEFTVEMTYPVGTPLDETARLVEPIEADLRDSVPRTRAVVTSIGAERDAADAAELGEHTAQLRFSLLAGGGQQAAADSRSMSAGGGEPGSAGAEGSPAAGGRGRGAGAAVSPLQAEQEALEVVRQRLERVPDVEINITRPDLFSFKTPVEVEVRGYELEELDEATEQVRRALEGLEGLEDVKSSIRPGNPEVQIVYDRDALARLGLDIRTVAELVRDKVQGYEATKFNRKDRKIPVRVRLSDIEQAGVDELRDLVVNPGGARPIPLSAVAEIELGRGPNEIRRIDQQRVGIVTANIEGVGLGSASQRIRARLGELELPSSVTTEVTGQSEEWETSQRSLVFALGLSVFLVYVIMASQFESLIYPLIILVTIPLALVGVVFALIALDMPVSVVVFLGGIMLAGIVVNNAIVLVDYVNQLKDRGHATDEALELAGAVRLRPILMTTLTTVLGLMPMALGGGDGAEIRQPMAITVIAGLSFSTLLTLIVIPTLYHGVDRLMGRRTDRKPSAELEDELANLDPGLLAPEDLAGDLSDSEVAPSGEERPAGDGPEAPRDEA